MNINLDEKEAAALVAALTVTLGKLNLVLDKLAGLIDKLAGLIDIATRKLSA